MNKENGIETKENATAQNKGEIPPELEIDFIIDNWGENPSSILEQKNNKWRLKDLIFGKNTKEVSEKLLEDCIKKLGGEAGDVMILRNKENDQALSREERIKTRNLARAKKELLDFFYSLRDQLEK